MTKADIAERIHKNTGYPKREALEMLEMVLSIMKSTLETGDNVKINGFGSFQVKSKNPRRGRNPQTAESMILDARRVVTFKASTILRQSVNKHKRR